MKVSKKFVWLCTCAAIAVPAAPAFAQDNEETSAESGENRNQIIVTARKTEETLLETPVAVSVLSGEFLDQLVDLASFLTDVAVADVLPHDARADLVGVRRCARGPLRGGAHRGHGPGPQGSV